VDVGVLIWLTDQTVTPVRIAREIEDRGYESLWLGDHSHLPVERRTPYPLGGELAPEYARFIDPFVGLSMAAVVTGRIKLGCAVCLVAERDPIVLAKEVATLDLLSGGRVQLGVGFGWNAEELADHGVAYADRFTVVRERVAAMKALWTQEVASYEGKFVRLSPSWCWPKPLQRPHPPILVGAAGPTGLRHVVDYGDGWIPVAGKVGERIGELRRLAEEAGRDPAALSVSVMSPRPTPATLEHYREAGVDRVILWIPPPGRADDVERTLDGWQELLAHAG
jgi:probable F420-dependent oxidoreductase